MLTLFDALDLISITSTAAKDYGAENNLNIELELDPGFFGDPWLCAAIKRKGGKPTRYRVAPINDIICEATQDREHRAEIFIINKIATAVKSFLSECPEKAKVLAVDFDGCLCKNAWPNIGEPNKRVIEAVKQRKAEGWKIILWTCREDRLLAEALVWCGRQGLCFDAVNENLPERIKEYGHDPRKIGADEYWDDLARTMHEDVFTRSAEEEASCRP